MNEVSLETSNRTFISWQPVMPGGSSTKLAVGDRMAKGQIGAEGTTEFCPGSCAALQLTPTQSLKKGMATVAAS